MKKAKLLNAKNEYLEINLILVCIGGVKITIFTKKLSQKSVKGAF